MKTLRRKRASAEVEVAEASAPPKKIKKRKYIVKPKCKICIAKDEYKSAGDIIFLDKKMAKHFMKHERVEPYVDFDSDDD